MVLFVSSLVPRASSFPYIQYHATSIFTTCSKSSPSLQLREVYLITYMCLTSPSLDAADPCVCRFVVCYSNISKTVKTQRTILNSICCKIFSLGMIARDPNRHYVYKVAESWESGGERRRLISAYSFSTMPSAFAGMLTHVAIKIIGGNASLSIVSTCNR